MRWGRPVWIPARIRGVYPSTSTFRTASRAAMVARTAVAGSRKTAIMPSPMRLTM